MPDIVIVGAGIGGVSFAIALKRQLGFDDFTIYEKASDVGGTWRDNIYPGASSDINMHFYSLSTDLNSDWPSTHGSQEDTQEYWQKLTQKYDLYRHIVFNCLVVAAEWNAKEQLYHIATEDVLTGTRISTTAKVLISALGLLEVPRFPKIPGIASFKGEIFHSARWDTGVDLRGKRVAVIGNGASATQFVPIISQDATVQVTEFCRTPNWFFPPIRADYSPLWKWTFRNIPFVMKFYRFLLYLRSELLYWFVFAHSGLRPKYTAIAKGYISRTAPKKDLEHLIPTYSLGCKRVVFDTNFLAALHRPNVSLNWDRIQSICDDGIITKKGDKLAFDVMIFATGFTTDRFPLPIVGNTGRTVQDYYDTQGGPKAYLGTTVPGFPNLFLLSGPNTATGHTSVILTEEIQINYIIKFVKPILDGLVHTFDVTAEATNDYNDKIHARLARSVFVGCVSWYRSGSDGKVSSIFPGPMMLYWWWLRQPQWSDYRVMATHGWDRQLRSERLKRLFSPTFYVGLLMGKLVSWISGS
ncbi:hypothetical protein B0H10DRAFT_2047523 [Mycena sp. CBHHK59/15]|nr:hypothetical protein B0H10DRAFT_2047523 [Mycena sp. CBHHK59/15]